ncbi:MAG: hypothetical protein ACO3BE_04715, partial [Gemmobacter sp.]
MKRACTQEEDHRKGDDAQKPRLQRAPGRDRAPEALRDARDLILTLDHHLSQWPCKGWPDRARCARAAR